MLIMNKMECQNYSTIKATIAAYSCSSINMMFSLPSYKVFLAGTKSPPWGCTHSGKNNKLKPAINVLKFSKDSWISIHLWAGWLCISPSQSFFVQPACFFSTQPVQPAIAGNTEHCILTAVNSPHCLPMTTPREEFSHQHWVWGK